MSGNGANLNALPSVDLVVLTWNDPDLARLAVESALSSRNVDVRVIVVDNGSEPAFSAYPDDRVTVLRSDRNLGVAHGRHLGASMGEREYVCFLDSDARLDPHTLEALIRALATPDVALVGPVYSGQPASTAGGAAPTLLRKVWRALTGSPSYGTGNDFRAGRREVDFVIGACQVFRRSIYEEVGGLDTSIFYGPEDIDMCLRLRLKGYKVLQIAEAVCDHPPRRRNRNLVTRRGMAHGAALTRHFIKHRRTPRRLRAQSSDVE